MKVLGMGDNVVDRYVNKKIMYPGGNAVNFAVYAKLCGMDSAYLGVFADDAQGRLIMNSLIELGVDVSACQVISGCSTERCDVSLNDGNRVFIGSGWEEGKEHKTLVLGEKELAYLKKFDVIHCGCYADMENEIVKIKDLAAVKTFDFSAEEEYRDSEYLGKICPYIDIALFSAEYMNENQIESLQRKVHEMGTPYVMITRGVKGQVLYDGKRFFKGHAKYIDGAVDTMGAGDSFFTAFVMKLIKGGWNKNKPLDPELTEQAFEFAAEFSAQNCLVEGAFGFGAPYED